MKVDCARAWHAARAFGPLTLYHVDGVEYVPEGSSSLANAEEAEMAVVLFQELLRRFPEASQAEVAMVSPYKA